ncbi:3-oxo-Delta(4,5)-steroid 5-beta-reductase [Citrus sinensis]|nr:3-oxo-Delta(4,5)-steroid 5-beta-reductase-like [Citrus sinensis]KAH9727644.1 3-oxo-Delta(4,5)-steroid 5-beta-reductase [Citrus sinensis]
MGKQDENPKHPSSSVALIIGVTGMAGLSLAEALKNNPTIPGGPWKVYGTARRPPPSWFPSSHVDHYITFDALDSTDTTQKLSSISQEVTHLFWVMFQRLKSEEINISNNSTMFKNVMSVVVDSNKGRSRLRHVTLLMGTKHYMGPVFDPSLVGQLIGHDPPFKEDSVRLPFPNFYYAVEDIAASYSPAVTYSVHRSSIIIGASSRSLNNSLLTLAVYATICRHQGLPFRYLGNKYTWEHFCDMSDSRVLAEQQIWAATTDRAKNQAFNCTNGDVFTWKSLWKLLSEIFDVEFVPFDEKEKFDVVEMMEEKGEIWDEIVEKHGLYKTKMEEITCFEALNTVLHLQFQHVSSMNKSREFGFFGFVDTMKSIRTWVKKLREMKIIP